MRHSSSGLPVQVWKTNPKRGKRSLLPGDLKAANLKSPKRSSAVRQRFRGLKPAMFRPGHQERKEKRGCCCWLYFIQEKLQNWALPQRRPLPLFSFCQNIIYLFQSQHWKKGLFEDLYTWIRGGEKKIGCFEFKAIWE